MRLDLACIRSCGNWHGQVLSLLRASQVSKTGVLDHVSGKSITRWLLEHGIMPGQLSAAGAVAGVGTGASADEAAPAGRGTGVVAQPRRRGGGDDAADPPVPEAAAHAAQAARGAVREHAQGPSKTPSAKKPWSSWDILPCATPMVPRWTGDDRLASAAEVQRARLRQSGAQRRRLRGLLPQTLLWLCDRGGRRRALYHQDGIVP